MCGRNIFGKNDYTNDRQRKYGINQFYLRDPIVGLYEKYLVKIVDCMNPPVRPTKFDEETWKFHNEARKYYDNCQNFMVDQAEYKNLDVMEATDYKDITAVLMHGIIDWDCDKGYISNGLCSFSKESGFGYGN
jgi:hypothetical protein